jgi:hypothetical protein
MRCEKCQGTGRDLARQWQACPECEGCGIAYCCETAGSNPPNCWPLNGSPGLYDPKTDVGH